MELFVDRADGGRQLAQALRRHAGLQDAIVLALPRGGVPVGYEVAHRLDLPLDVFLVRKLGVPGHEELAMGAIASGDVLVLNPEVVMSLRISAQVIDAVAARERPELERRDREYRDARPAPDLHGRTVILVDDGLATGSTMRAAVASVRRQGAGRIVVAVPVASPEACAEFRLEVDEFVCLLTPEWFAAVGEWYQDFSQTTDEEVRELLARAQKEHAGHGP
jgi:predicted phosphoribosyltransferase